MAQVASRIVTVYSTLGNNSSTVNSTAGTWGELQSELAANRVNYDNMKTVVGETQNTLESPDAILPNEPFTLFLFPNKVKSGGYDSEYGLTATEFFDEYDENDFSKSDLEDTVFRNEREERIVQVQFMINNNADERKTLLEVLNYLKKGTDNNISVPSNPADQVLAAKAQDISKNFN